MRHTFPMILAAMLTIAAAAQTLPTRNSQAVASDAFGRLPFAFEPNRGQTDERVKFLARGGGYVVFLTPDEAVLKLRRGEQMCALRMKLLGARADTQLAGVKVTPGFSNYFVGDDPAQWRESIPHYGRVQYKQAYPGIDLIFYGNEGRLEYDFVVKPGTDASAIRLQVEGAKSLELDRGGNLVMHMDGSEVRLQRPIVYQQRGRIRQPVDGKFVVSKNNQVGFALGNYDRNLALVIDPVLTYATFLPGGSGTEQGRQIARDTSGQIYVAGTTNSTDFPTKNGAQLHFGGGTQDLFVSKMNASGTALVFSTYLGGNNLDFVNGIAIDTSGDTYIAGETRSTNFPTKNALQTSNHGNGDAFVTKFGPTGALVYSTYLGGAGEDIANGVAADSSGNAYVAGQTQSPTFPVHNALQPAIRSGESLFVSKINPTGTAFAYSTFLGGTGSELGGYIAVDNSGNAYVTGRSSSVDYPVVNAHQSHNFGAELFNSSKGAQGKPEDVVLSKLNTAGSALIYSTYLGGLDNDEGWAIAVDSRHNAYIFGISFSKDFPVTSGVIQRDCKLDSSGACNFSGVVSKFDFSGGLVYSTYLGGSRSNQALAIAVDTSGNAYLSGWTDSPDFPVTSNALQKQLLCNSVGCSTIFLTTLNSTASGFVYYSTLLPPELNTFAGGGGGSSLALDSKRNVYLTSGSSDPHFPVTANALQKTPNGSSTDAVVFRLSIVADLLASATAAPSPVNRGTNLTYTLKGFNRGPDRADSLVLTDTIPTGTTFVSASTTAGSCTTPAVGGTGTVTCRRTSLTKGATWVLTLVVKVNPTDAHGSTIANTAHFTSNTQDLAPSNNTVTVSTKVN